MAERVSDLNPEAIYDLATVMATALRVGDVPLMESAQGQVLAFEWNVTTKKVALLMAPDFRTVFVDESALLEVWRPKDRAGLSAAPIRARDPEPCNRAMSLLQGRGQGLGDRCLACGWVVAAHPGMPADD